MPYIVKDRRTFIDPIIELMVTCVSVLTHLRAGECNYIITKFLLGVFCQSNPHYVDFNEIIGVLECCKLEMYRKKLAVYEDEKAKENGEVF